MRLYVERFPDLYERVLQSRPGISGLESIYYHAVEERLLENSEGQAETEEIYFWRCIPRKARLETIYQPNRNMYLHILLMLKTVMKRMPLK